MSDYYDLDDQPCDLFTWARIMERRHLPRAAAERGESSPADDPTRVGSDHVGDMWVSTVWLGLDHAMPGSPFPLIYETMVFDGGGDWEDYQKRYPTRAAALAGHDEVVAALRAGLTP